MSEKAQTIVTQKGDRLLDLVRRVYQIRDQDRILSAALVISAHSPDNHRNLHNRFNHPLDAGISIDFPPWPQVEQGMRAADARKQTLANAGAAPRPSGVGASLAPQMRQVGISRQAPLGERTTSKEMIRALGLSAADAATVLRPLTPEDVDPTRTRSPVVAKMADFGKAIADNVPRQTLHELFAQSEKGFHQSWDLMLRQAAPRTFAPNVDTQPTILGLLGGFFMAFAQRLVREAKDELARRHRLLSRVLARPECKDRVAGQTSVAFPGDAQAVLAQLLVHAQGEAPEVLAPGVLDQLKKQYGFAGSVQEEKAFFPAPITGQPYVAFLDHFFAGGTDGRLAQTLLDLGTRVSDAHKQAVHAAAEWLGGQSIDARVGPNEALAKVLSEVLKRMRASRSSLPVEAQNRQLADERHLLSGRNFLTFRKDMCKSLDQRLTLVPQLSPEQRVVVLLALLIQDGHRLTTLRVEEIEAACDRFIQASTP